MRNRVFSAEVEVLNLEESNHEICLKSLRSRIEMRKAITHRVDQDERSPQG
jgi:hypothetical protein